VAAIPEVFVAAGSNVRPRASLARALATLRHAFPGLQVSRAYANAAVGFAGDDFINLVMRFETRQPVEALLESLKAVEQEGGRAPGAPKWGPRALDLDLLMYGDLVGCHAGTTLPHRDIATRAWVLGPLAELAPETRHPVSGETFAALWQRFARAAHPLHPVSLEDADP
jgi:2-amino-4-hydroxy-6-hydroxymethyldihydropteridine diphosphokinase